MSSNNRYKLENNSDLETINSFKILMSNIKALKDKTWGCPWQKIQSHISLIPFLYEENNELIDAIYEKNAENFLKDLGNPYKEIFIDLDGTIAIEWGAYGVPESFLIYNNEIIKKYIGPLNQELVDEINLLIK